MAKKDNVKTSGNTAVRLLVDSNIEGKQYRANNVVSFSEEIASSLCDGNIADATPEAVDYCVKELGAVVIEHSAEVVAEMVAQTVKADPDAAA
jgi:hypothetical protein